jgi:antitoxin PrlF
MIFLDFLAQDIQNNPQNLRPITSDFVDRVRSLVSDVDFDMDESLDDGDE